MIDKKQWTKLLLFALLAGLTLPRCEAAGSQQDENISIPMLRRQHPDAIQLLEKYQKNSKTLKEREKIDFSAQEVSKQRLRTLVNKATIAYHPDQNPKDIKANEKTRECKMNSVWT